MANLLQNEGSSTSNVSRESSDSTIEINVMSLDSQIYCFRVEENMPVSIFKENIANDIGVPVGQQQLIFQEEIMDDSHRLSDYHLENGHTLHLVARQPAQSQPSSDTSAGETNRTSSTPENDANAGAPRIQVGEVSQSVLLGTTNVGGQGEGVVSDLSPVIEALMNSSGMGSQSGINSGNFGSQFSTLPFSTQTSSLVGGPVPSADAVGFGPVGVGNSPRIVDIHMYAGTSVASTISAVGTRASSDDGVLGHGANTAGSTNSMGFGLDSIREVSVRNVNMEAVPGRPTGVANSVAAQPGLDVSTPQQPSDSALLSSTMNEVTSGPGNFVGSMPGEIQVASGLGGGQGGGIDLLQIVQLMMPVVSRAVSRSLSVPQPNETRSNGTVNHEVHSFQNGIQQVAQSIERSDPPEEIFVESNGHSHGNGVGDAEDLENEVLRDASLISAYVELLEQELRPRREGNSRRDE